MSKRKNLAPKRPQDHPDIQPTFESQEAASSFRLISARQPYIERGFIYSSAENYGLPIFVAEQIEKRGWLRFCAQPIRIMLPMVHEFLANFSGATNEGVLVRGRRVPFSAAHINELYGLPDFRDQYSLMKGPSITKSKRQLVLRELTVQGSEWIVSPQGAHTCWRKSLKPSHRVWYHFIRTRLMPTTHDNIVSEERMFLLYALIKGETINVGKVIYEQIKEAAGKNKGKIFFPSLISELCIRVEVPIILQEVQLLNKQGAITSTCIARLIREDDAPNVQPAEAHAAEGDRSVDYQLLFSEVQGIKQRQEQLHDMMVSFATYTRDRDRALHATLRQASKKAIPDFPEFPEESLRGWGCSEAGESSQGHVSDEEDDEEQ